MDETHKLFVTWRVYKQAPSPRWLQCQVSSMCTDKIFWRAGPSGGTLPPHMGARGQHLGQRVA